MKKVFAAFLLVFVIFQAEIVSAQNVIDSLQKVLTSSKSDTQKVNVMVELTWEYRTVSPETALNFGEKALVLSKDCGFEEGMAKSLNAIGVVYNHEGEYEKALEFYELSLKKYKGLHKSNSISNELSNIGYVYQTQGKFPEALDFYYQALKVSIENPDPKRAAITFGNIGILYYQQGYYAKALSNYFKSLKIREMMRDKEGMSYVLGNIGIIYDEQKNYPKALEYYYKSLSIRTELNDKQGIATSFNNIGMIYSAQKNFNKAMINFQQALLFSEESDFSTGIAGALCNMADVYKAQNNNTKAKEFYTKANRVYSDIDDSRGISSTLNGFGELLLRKKDYKEAKKDFEEALKLAKNLNDKELMKITYFNLAELYRLTNDYKNAYKFSMLFSDTKDSIYNEESMVQMSDMQTKYDTDQRIEEIGVLTKEKDIQSLKLNRNRILLYSFSAGIILILTLMMVVFRAYKNKILVNDQLEAQKEEIENQKKKSDDLLLNILPFETAEELKTKGIATVKHYELVSVMFSDFKGFTRITENIAPETLVKELNKCFIKFDEITEKYQVEKIKTIGDAYMCAGGIPIADVYNPVKVILAGFEFQKFIEINNDDLFERLGFKWELRMGIHTGQIIAGIVGKKKFAYDIWGDTVNIASRLETNSEPGRLNISSHTYESIKNYFDCTHRGKIPAKNKGELDMYFVDRLKPIYSEDMNGIVPNQSLKDQIGI
ncbi:MAG: tetratricopeptide repeat protein [Bacteroidetes bacterium]|nr:tetratricopeptide repeat protein [Bacteroidota bacterium]